MNIFTYIWNYPKLKSQIGRVTIGTEMQQSIETNGVTGQPENISTVFTAIDRICNAMSRMPITVWADNAMGRMEMKQHRLYWLLRYQPNPYENAEKFWNTTEYHRLVYGNAFIRLHKDTATGFITELERIHPAQLQEVTIERGRITSYIFRETDNNSTFTVEAADIWHFINISEDGCIGLTYLQALKRETNINERATAHIDNYHKNNGIQTIALETELPGQLSAQGKQAMDEQRAEFMKSNGGPINSGTPLMLPAFTKAVKLNLSFADAQLIETLKYTREQIAAAFGIPLFMLDGSAEKLDIEQLTLLFRVNTIGPIVYKYVSEITSKSLTRDEILLKGICIKYDTSVIIEMDYTQKVTTTKEQVVNGMMTPNEAARILGNKPITGEYGDKHFMQAQYIPLEEFKTYNPLKKTDPNLKTQQNDKDQTT